MIVVRLCIARVVAAGVRRFRWGRSARSLVRRLLPEGATLTIRPGFGRATVRAPCRAAITMSYLLDGDFEPRERDVLVGLARSGGAFFDVGANIGVHAIAVAERFPTVSVVAIEPLPENASSLAETVRRHQLENLEVVEAAAGEREGSTRLYSDTPDLAYASRIAYPNSVAEWSVPMITLDSVWCDRGCPPVCVVKIDVEGSEADVLRGASRLLETLHPALLVEVNSASARAQIQELLEPIGYSLSAELSWNNVLFTDSGVAGR